MKKTILVLTFLIFIGFLGTLYFSQKHIDRSSTDRTDEEFSFSARDMIVVRERERRAVDEHEVVEGDSIYSIAEYYGLNIQSILINNDITEEDSLVIGQIIKIPPTDGLLTTVKEGDTLEDISKQYDVSKQIIADFNWLDHPYTLEDGMQLFVPMDFE